MLLLSESTLFFLNLTSEFRSVKSSVSGRIKAWASNLPADLHHTQSNSGSQSASVPPSTIFSKSTTTMASKATTVKLHLSHKNLILDVSENVLVGGFDDVDSEVDELLECEAVFQSTKRGRIPVKVHPSVFFVSRSNIHFIRG
jgi:hypothetical protein